ncbi:MAG TPA: lactonase family protein [Verrucomicrobiota bacterium]|nr:lactonase family protein [Verrucomicrobiota bacterium]
MLPLIRRFGANILALVLGSSVSAETYQVYVGTYTGPKSEGIYSYRFNTDSGTVEPLGLAAKSVSPSFLALSPDGRFLYSVNEENQWKGQPGGYVTAYARQPGQTLLKELNQQSSMGAGPCHLTVDSSGRNVLAANYGGGSVVCLPVNMDGSLKPHSSLIQHTGSSVNPNRQKEPHAHSVNLSPDNRFAFVADLGLDKVFVHRLNPGEGTLTPNDPPAAKLAPGSGPRHFAFAPNGQHAFVINEMLSTLTSFAYEAPTGVLKEVQTISTLPKGFTGDNSTAQVCVHPNGRFVYGSNRGDDSIAVFALAPDGKLTFVERVSTQGKTPRNFNLDPTGIFLWAANQNSNSIVLFRVDPATGRLTPTGKTLEVGSPVCVVFAPAI